MTAASLPLLTRGAAGTTTTAGEDEAAPLRRLRWAVRAVLTLGVAASVAANVLHARPHLISQIIAAWPPLALLLTVELISRVPSHHRSLAVLRLLATAAIAGIAAWVSYRHMAGVAAHYGETGITAYLLPLSVDGLVVVASISLIEIAGRIRASSAPPATAVDEPAFSQDRPEPDTVRAFASHGATVATPISATTDASPLDTALSGQCRPAALDEATPQPPRNDGTGEGGRDWPANDWAERRRPQHTDATTVHRHGSPHLEHRPPSGTSSTAAPAAAEPAHDEDHEARTVARQGEPHGPAEVATPPQDPAGLSAGHRGRGERHRHGGDAQLGGGAGDTAAAVAYWRGCNPSMRPADVATRIGRSERTVRRYWPSGVRQRGNN